MKKKSMIFLGIGSVVALSCALVFNLSSNSQKSDTTAINAFKENRIQLNFSEQKLSTEKLKSFSDIIVKGTVVELKEKAIKKCETTSSNNEKLTIEVPVALYDIKVNENISNSKKAPETLTLALTDPNINLEVGKDYTFVLYEVKGNSEISGNYALVSFTQGLYELNTDTQDLISVKTKEVIPFTEFKNKFKDK